MRHDPIPANAAADGSRLRLLLWLGLYALAMALVEAAIVVHLRHLYYPLDPRSLFPLASAESHRPGAGTGTRARHRVMILAVAVLAERGGARRFAAFVFVFGLWDLGYYAWLKLVLNWPRAWLEWDVMFLLPWPWFGPWLAAALIAALFTLWGGWVLASGRALRPRMTDIVGFVTGTLLALVAFLAPAWSSLPGGAAAFRGWQPGIFLWALYGPGVALMAAALWHAGRDRPAR